MMLFDSDTTDKHFVEEALLEHKLVDDCLVLMRRTKTASEELIAYIVSGKTVQVEHLHARLQTLLPALKLPVTIIPIATFPLTELGRIDEQALIELEVIEPELVQQWENKLRSVPEIEHMAVVADEIQQPLRPLHLSDLVPNWESNFGSAFQCSLSADCDRPPFKQSMVGVPKASAISESGSLSEIPAQSETLAAVLQRAALEASENGITYLKPDGSEIFQSYSALLDESEKVLTGLRKLNLKPQDKVIFQFKHNQDFIPAFWGCILGGFVPVPLSTASNYCISDSAVSKLLNVAEKLEYPLILTSEALSDAVQKLSTAANLKNWRVESIDSLRCCEPNHYWHHSQPDELAVLIFTSGSTGKPKGVMLSQRNILSNIAASAHTNKLTKDDVSLNWLHLDHVGSLVRCCIREVYVGCQQIHAPTEAVLDNPLQWLDWIEQYHVTFAWAPNFALGLINAQAEAIKQRQWDLSSVKSLLSVAEAIVPKTAQRFLELLSPHGLAANAMHSAWGMSETGAAVVFSHHYLINLLTKDVPFVEVGAPVPGLQMRIVDSQGEVVDEGSTGALQIRGPMVTCGYYQNPSLDWESFTEDGWFRTGDQAFIWDGRLTVVGRQKQVIIINGLNHYNHEIEAVVEAVAGVEPSYTAACAMRTSSSDTDQLVIFFHPTVSDDIRLVELLREIRSSVARNLKINPTYLIPVTKDSIPKTTIGKIQRLQLKQQFEAGEFNGILKRIDLLTSNSNTVPDWFYERVWQRRETITFSTRPQVNQTLIFLDSLGLGQLLCNELSSACTTVEMGSKFAQLGPDRYCIDPKNSQHYRKLFKRLSESGKTVRQILHLWTYSKHKEIDSAEILEQAQTLGTYSILFLIQALNDVQGAQQPVQLFVISSNAQFILMEDAVAYEKAPLLGLIKTIPQELPWVDCRHIDLTLESIDRNTACILREILVLQNEREVAYREQQRLVPRLQKLKLPHQQTQELPFKQGGLYIISGGLGDIAVSLARYLLEHYQARLLLLGRTPLPNQSTWQDSLKEGTKTATRIRAYQYLQQLDGDIIYEAVDICNLTDLQQSIDRAQSYWQCNLDGIIHLAGIGNERLLIEETWDSFTETLAPKVYGTWALHQLIKNNAEAIFVSFSSVISLQGALSVGAYAAANCFLNAFWSYQRQHALQSYCFASSTWAGVGISRGYEYRDSRYAQGREVMSPEQGLNSLLVSLHGGPAHVFAGLNGSNPHIRRYRKDIALQTKKLHAYFTATSRLELHFKPEKLIVPDRFGTSSRCEFLQVQEIPLTRNGAVDYGQLGNRDRQTTAYTAPKTGIEHQLLAIWQRVLGLSKIGIHDSFFELGGSSLMAVQLFSQIEKTVGKQLPLSVLFQAATIEKLGNILEQNQQSESIPSLVAIQPQGSKPPLFAVHEILGNVLFYRDLSRHLGLDQPFYGLQPQLVDNRYPYHEQIKAMAAHYIEEMRSLQPEGPYYLLGYSLGGLIAFEMAQQLHQQEQQIALLALIDTRSLRYFKEFNFCTPLPLYRQLLLSIQKLLVPDSKKQATYLIGKLTEKLLSQLKQYYETLFTSDSERMLRTAIVQNHVNALKQYSPQIHPGRVTLFTVYEDTEFFENYDFDLGWSKLAAGGIDFHLVPGNHVTLYQEPHVQVLAKQLRECLDAAVSSSNIG